MANRSLLPVYKMLYGRNFHYVNFDQRLEMQKAVYLLQDMGVPIGDYGFRWYQHGPYSQNLQDDMYYEDGHACAKLQLSKEHSNRIDQLRSIIDDTSKGEYSTSYWVECLASLHYLRENVLAFNASETQVVSELERRKPHLSSHTANLAAYHLVEGLFS